MGDSATRVVIAHREPSFILQAGLRTHERDILPDLRLPVHSHSGVRQVLKLVYRCGGSAGMVLANAPASRFTPWKKIRREPEAARRL